MGEIVESQKVVQKRRPISSTSSCKAGAPGIPVEEDFFGGDEPEGLALRT